VATPDGAPVPDLAKLLRDRDALTRQIESLTLRRERVEALISAVSAYQSQSGNAPRTHDMILEYLNTLPDGAGVTVEDVLKYGTTHSWNNTARSRTGAIRSALSRGVTEGWLRRLTTGNPAVYALNHDQDRVEEANK
jgi:hypothetical protein